MLIEITEKEFKLVQESRAKELAYMVKEEKKRNCVHDYQYEGHGHNDDCYVCTKCQEFEWR